MDYLAQVRSLSNGDACREYVRLANVFPAPTGCTSRHHQQPTEVAQPFDWSSCVAAFTPEHQRKVADWRGYSARLVAWLHEQRLIGLLDHDAVAFPVHDEGGSVSGCHYRKTDASWRYYPSGTTTRPLIIGNLASAKTVLAFESQWDCFAALDCMAWHIEPLEDTAALVTRGAANGRLITGLCRPDAKVYAFVQNDEAADKWLTAMASACGCECLRVATPPPHKDLNDWIRAGAGSADVRSAIAGAEVFTPPRAPKVRPPDVSGSLVVLVDEPAESDDPKLAPFPVDALPPTMAALVEAVSCSERVPHALPAICSLGVASAAIGAGLEIASGPNRVTRGNLYLLGSAESGSGKSETFRLIAAPILDQQTRLLETWREKTMPQFQSESRILDKEIAGLERKAARAADPMERERLRGELEYRLARKAEISRRGAMPSLIAQDVTTERLAVLLHENREVLFSTSADARKLVDNLLGRYNPGKSTDESLYLSAYSGDFVRVDRQGREAIVLHHPCLSLCWFVQPDLLTTLLETQSLSASGFLPRLLLCHTRAVPRRIEATAAVSSSGVRNQWSGLIADLLATYHAAGTPHRIEPVPGAVRLLIDYYNAVVDRRAGDLADVGAFAARYAESAWRLAVVLHAALHGLGAHDHPLHAETAANAIRLVEWFSEQQLDILAKGRLDAAQALEDQVLELLDSNRERKGLDHLTAREVQRARIAPTAEAARALLARMEADHLLIGLDIRPPGGGTTTRTFRRIKNPVPG